jgi:hypothetical protein
VIAVIFEVWPAEGRHGDYLEIAASLTISVASKASSPLSGSRA